MNKRFLSLILIFSGGLICANEPAPTNAMYEKVGNLILESEDYIVKPNSVPVEDPRKNYWEKLKEKAARFTTELSEVRQKELVFNLFSRVGKLTPEEKCYEDYSLKELNLIIGSAQSKKMCLHRAIDRTQTMAGSAVLASMLSAPATNIEVIEKRKRVIKYLLENEDLCNHLDSLLKEAKEGQSSLFNCWNIEAALDESLRVLFYAPKSAVTNYLVNKSPKNLQFQRLMNLWATGVSCVTVPIGLIGVISATGYFMKLAPGTGPKIGVGAIGSLYGGLLVFSLKTIIDQMKLMNSIIRNMHHRLRGISKVVQSFDNISRAVYDHPHIYEGLSLVNNLSDFVLDPKSISSDLAYLKDLLKKSVFEKEKFGLFGHAGNVLAAHEYIDDVKDHFISPLEAIGEIDAFLSIVKLIREHKDKRNSFCFVDFIAQDKPLLELHGVWSTLVGEEKAVPANIIFGGDNPNNALFNGPNGSGKSILMKAAVTCDTLGRAFGIAPAQKAKMTLFKKVYTYVNVQEDPRLGLSTFMAQEVRGKQILNEIAKNKNEKLLLIVDEPYSGTVGDAVDHETYKFSSEIAKNPNVICLLATHTEKATGLANEQDPKFANYHFEIIDDGNNITRTYKMLNGKCDWWYNNVDGRRERYIDRFLR